MPQKYDILLKGGEVIDASQNLKGNYDVALAGNKVAQVAKDIPKEEAKQVKNVSGKIVTPGLIDIHGHFYHSFLDWNIDPDKCGLPNGVTTAVDAASSGCDTFQGLKKFIILQSTTRVFALLNICNIGMVTLGYHGELWDINLANPEKALKCIEQNRDVIIGMKALISTEHSGGRNAMPVLEMALDVTAKTKVPLQLHLSDSPIFPKKIIPRLRPGDCVTHCYNRDVTLLDANHKVRQDVFGAVERGVFFDVGAGMHLNHFTIQSTREQGFMAQVMSADVTDSSPWSAAGWPPVAPTLLDVMNEFLALGWSVEEVVRCNTANAAAAIRKSSELGTLRPGALGDVAVFRLQDGDFSYTDWHGHVQTSKQKLVAEMTIIDGKICYSAK